jgi:DnaJ-domain-containing protein 1
MPKKTNLKSKLKTADDICRILTGKRMNVILSRGIEMFGEDIFNRAVQEPAEDPEEVVKRMPYMVLGVNQGAPDFVVKAAYKSYMKECHPDTSKPDADKAARVNNAYEAICKERGIPK